ncbi:hypothetical protein [Micromonospora chokoriensis]|uniref:Uncharacterized protein n=1 Tax=Micromonospora chokoriensis TaxID=356851 RepID=A0A1C4X804_9ACTN|nr:hypothetical protein [Micromonospora chokoriensis]SCF04495.1 hypothetical protein GA0070612_3275 [Micromonospora chokoriensis]
MVLNVRNYAQGHLGVAPEWNCEVCGQPWPCATFQEIPPPGVQTATLVHLLLLMAGAAIRDLATRSDGPPAHAVLKRFAWFMELDDRHARHATRWL